MFYKKTKNKKQTKNKGISLVEIMMVVAIFGILLVIVIFNYNKFQNKTTLANMAYEIALTIREAQFFGTAVKGYSDNNFSQNIGVYFSKESKFHQIYESPDRHSDPNMRSVNTFELQKNITVTNLIKCKSSGSEKDLPVLDIYFNRPNPEPLLGSGVEKVQIKISIPDGSMSKYVEINSVGAIDIKDEECS